MLNNHLWILATVIESTWESLNDFSGWPCIIDQPQEHNIARYGQSY